jgi:glycolate oxidase FAD binding subunit
MRIHHSELHLMPTTPTELRTALADTRTMHPKVLVRGDDTASGWGSWPEPADAVLDTSRLAGVLKYDPADMTVAVLAGTRMRDLQAVVAEKGQRVAFDAARVSQGATVGGLLATADAGPAQHAYGTLRDLTIGATVVLGDGTAARSGGHVIKNVAGYDVAKLFHGSLGTLGVLAEVALRLHPLPSATMTVSVPCTVADGVALAGRIIAQALEPAALEWSGDKLLVRFEGSTDGVTARIDAVKVMTTALTKTHTGHEQTMLWQAVDAIAHGVAGDTTLRVGGLPSHGARIIAAARTLSQRHGLSIETTSSLGVGIHTIRVPAAAPAAHARMLGDLRKQAAVWSAVTTVRRRDGLPSDTDVWGTPPTSLAVQRAVKRQFDPANRFGGGRFAPWW